MHPFYTFLGGPAVRTINYSAARLYAAAKQLRAAGEQFEEFAAVLEQLAKERK